MIRRSMVVAGAVAVVLAGCAGTDEGGTPDDTVAAPADTEADVATATEQDAADVEEDTDPQAHEDGDAEEAGTDMAEADGGHGEEAGTDMAEADGGHGEEAADHDDDGAATSVATADVDRVVEIDMEDIAFSVEELEFAVGERVQFVFDNVGAAPHEALIGDMHLQEEHEQEMAEGGGHHDGGHHGEVSMLSLEPGEAGTLVHEFTEPGELWMGCHVPGHWGAGMQTRITVTS